ncbi:putative amino-acid permease C15C4.04c [Lasiodiplodia hormozganensis]|uniref:Amino-acid permease C15C4.04c n=1 Tax=Lasiodiplodia hormozganensis TaxID=869390 RepID=A0AA40D778_9PEZI|nr:putative amino-acid permease C15C4.04c [Lasiodiplodia hormozganensis]
MASTGQATGYLPDDLANLGKDAKMGAESDQATGSADQALEAMGYSAELSRNRSTPQMAFMAFVLASIPRIPPDVYACTCQMASYGELDLRMATAAIFWTFGGVAVIIICILVLAKNGRHDGAYVFTEFEHNSGWPAGWSFCIGLLQAAYATSSTGMIISMCEEARAPSVQVPKAMVATVIINTFAGLLILIPLVFVLPDPVSLLQRSSNQPVPTIIKDAVGSPGGAFALLVPLIVLGLLCGICCTTATSRAVWAFARDGAIPGSKYWKMVNFKLDQVPFNAMMLSMAVQLLLGLIYFGSSAAFNAFSGVGVVCLTASYAVPIAASLGGGRAHVKKGKFYLGPTGYFCNVVALCWSLLAIPLFCMPAVIPVDATTMNYASVVFAAFILLAVGWYIAWGFKHYVGPPHDE